MTYGSQQLRTYRRLRAEGLDTASAAASVGMSLAEAESWDADDAVNPPPPEALEPIAAPIGHNSKEDDMTACNATADELRLFVERVERLEEEKKGLADDIKDVMSEMKSRGYDTKIVRKLLAIRKRKPDDVAEEMAVLETYASALGMQLSLI